MKDLPEEGRDWWLLHSVLRAELKTKPWEFPCIQRPYPDHPAVHDPHTPWDDGSAENMYRELERALNQKS
jgi:hypothetical protein